MKGMEELRDMLCDELSNITEQGEITSGSLEIIDKLTHSIKSIDTIMVMEEASYSNEGSYGSYGSYGRGVYGRGSYAYDDGYSRRGGYSRARGRNASRDSRGRYSSRMMDDGEM